MSAVIRLRKSSSQNKTNYVNQKITTDLRATINESNHQNVPVGSVMATLTVSGDPNGWFICDGRALPRQYYPALFAAIGTRYGVTADTSIFLLPDLRGAFLRGTGTNPIYDSYYAGPAVNSTPQRHATQSHSHAIVDKEHNHSYVDRGQSSNNTTPLNDQSADNTNDTYYTGNALTGIEFTEEEPKKNVPIDSKNTAGYVIERDNKETRPFNYGVNWIIKA